MDKGAHFFKCDFQVHTPRDLNWKGEGAVSDEERKEYANLFVLNCRRKKINAVAVTDHHDLAFFHYIKSAAHEETGEDGQLLAEHEKLVVFPGMELTLGIPCQAILILDADFPVDFLNQIPTILGVSQNNPSKKHHINVSRLEDIKQISNLESTLDKHDFLRGRYIILPNVGKDGQFSMMRQGFYHHYKDMSCVGGYVDGDLDKISQGTKDILSGRSREWGNKSIGVFQTSDSRSRDFEKLGKHHTWVKWAIPTAEALRQACLSKESRISQSEPSLPTTIITKVEVSNSKFLGPISLKINPQYNVTIGGRGTGKSTILEYIRWALCDQPITLDDDLYIPQYQQKRSNLIEKTLLPFDSSVRVSFLVNGVLHIVKRSAKTHEILLKIGDGEFQACNEDNVRSILPIQAYSQKQLSNVGIKIEELERFIKSPIQKEIDSYEDRLAKCASNIRSTYEKLKSKRSLESDIRKYDLEIKSLNGQAETLRRGLKNVSPGDQQIIDNHNLYYEEVEVVESWKKKKDKIIELFNEFYASIESFKSVNVNEGCPNKNILQTIENHMDQSIGTIKEKSKVIYDLLDDESENKIFKDSEESLSEWAKLNEKIYRIMKEPLSDLRIIKEF